jgi:hypothetical protein
MAFTYFILGIVFTFWSVYEIIVKESTLIKTFYRNETPKSYWAQVILTMLIGSPRYFGSLNFTVLTNPLFCSNKQGITLGRNIPKYAPRNF